MAGKRVTLRVLHVLPQLSFGGAERIAADLITWQTANGIEPALCVLRKDPDGLRPFGLAPAVSLDFGGSLRDVRGLMRCVRALRSYIRATQPDVIHAHLWPAALLAGFGAPATNATVVVHVHDTQPWLRSRRVADQVQRWLLRRALPPGRAKFIAVADAVKRYTEENLPWTLGRVITIHNGINQPPRAKPTRGGPLMIGSAGRLDPEKGFSHLISAAARLRDAGTAFHMKIAGRGAQESNLRDMIRRLKLDEYVTLIGVVNDVGSFYSDLDIFVLPSTAEGLPLCVLEAMSAGLPVVATNVGGVSEAIEDRRTGFLVPPASDVALASAMSQLSASQELRAALGLAAMECAQRRFTANRMAREVSQLYQ